jgi:hypothetical protein
MKAGRTLQELAAEIERQRGAKRDFVATTNRLHMTGPGSDRGAVRLELSLDSRTEDFSVMPHTHQQIASRLDIPKRYYDRMLSESPWLLADNVNHWFDHKTETRMLRTMDGRARAFLSDRYRPLDNADLATAVLPALAEQELKIVSCEVTDTKLYIKAVSPRVQGEVNLGDVVQAGVVISNSEVGLGSLLIQGLLYRLACLNGMIRNDANMRKFHTGSRHSAGEDGVRAFLSDEAIKASDTAVWLQVRDLTKAALEQSHFNRYLEELREAAGQRIEGSVGKVVELTQKHLGLTGEEGDSVLKHLIEGGDLSRWGLANAVTRTAQDVGSYDRATELERIGGAVIELQPSEWKVISEAA